jgi:transcriptional regulator with XRE-family HTH domain
VPRPPRRQPAATKVLTADEQKLRSKLYMAQLVGMRRAAKLTEEQVARRMGVGVTEVTYIERGGIDELKVSVLARYLVAIGADLELYAVFDGVPMRLR